MLGSSGTVLLTGFIIIALLRNSLPGGGGGSLGKSKKLRFFNSFLIHNQEVLELQPAMC